MVEEDLGQATIVYEGPDGTDELTVDNEHVAYFQDHWVVKTGENEAGHDTVRRIPAQRVYHVERDIEEFEQEVATVLDDVRSVADEFERGVGSIREEFETITEEVGTLFSGPGDRHRGGDDADVVRIDIEEETDEPGASDEVGETDDESGADDESED